MEQDFNKTDNSRYIVESGFFAGMFAVFFAVSYMLVFEKTGCWTDFRSHIYYANEFFVLGKEASFFHLGFHTLIYIFHSVFSVSLQYAAVFISSVFLTITALIMYLLLVHSYESKYGRSVLLIITLALMIVTSVYAGFYDINIYRGSWGPNAWHNPTLIVLKPFAILSVVMFLVMLESRSMQQSLVFMSGMSLVLLGSVLMKPNFFLSFSVASVLFMLVTRADSRLVVKYGLVLVPSLSFILYQYFSTFDSAGQGGIAVELFAVWGYFTSNIPTSILFSILFPLALLLLSPVSVTSDRKLMFAWLLFIVALFQFSLLLEDGPRKLHANWVWGYIVSMHVLFLYSVVHLLNMNIRISAIPDKVGVSRLYILNIMFFLHFASGVYYYLKIMGGGDCT